jgi:hypothetical protein
MTALNFCTHVQMCVHNSHHLCSSRKCLHLLAILELIMYNKKRMKNHEKGVEESYTVKKVSDFPVPRRNVTNQTFPGRE